jgi:drug/metabolite transporter (DMT)-like permease
LRGGLNLVVYIVAFNWALRLTAASHVSLYIGASPVWTLLWEERPQRSEWTVAETCKLHNVLHMAIAR